MTCFARWDFRYGGRLAGDALRPKIDAPILREGRAWGAAVATWHADESMLARFHAEQALRESIMADVAAIQDVGLPVDLEVAVAMQERLSALLAHYTEIVPKLRNLTRLEDEVNVPLPSRAGGRSNRYRFVCKLDGETAPEDGGKLLVEFKLRGRLTPLHLLQIAPQHRWYAWGHQQETGEVVSGVLIDERLNEVPKEPRRLKNGRLSHVKDQLTTAEWYTAECERDGVKPKPDVVAHLKSRQWGHVWPLMFRESELEEAGHELVSAAKLIRDLDSGELWPIRNVSQAHCNGCAFRAICPTPMDRLVVDNQFERVPPKRNRQQKEEEAYEDAKA